MGKSKVLDGFVNGFAVHMAVVAIAQDVIGKEGYIKRAQDHWVDSAYSLPIAITALVVLLCASFIRIRDEARGA
jgi:hypothetical protein